MKRKVRTQPSNSFYTTEPPVSRKSIAANPPVPNANLSNKAPKSVPAKPGRLSGLSGFSDKGKPRGSTSPAKITVPKLGTKMNFPQQGKKSKKA
jgi:hypothetical protein